LAEPPDPRAEGGIGAAVAAANQRARRSMLRNHGGGHAPVSFLELFFDLVFVFAITQLSHFLKTNLGWLGFAQALILFLAVWWAWMYTTWATNWANPDRLPVRIMLLLVMLLALVLAVALPEALGNKAWLFAACYVSIQIGRTLFMAIIMRHENPHNARNMLRITLWFCFAAPLWIAGALRGEEERLAWWILAIAIEYVGPVALFRVPGMGKSSSADWDISGSHMAERCALFIIVALGEGIIITGASFAALSLELGRVWAFVCAFFSSVLMWWLYFDIGAVRGSQHIAGHTDPGRIARDAFTYVHMPIVLGILVYAVADAKSLANWQDLANGKLLLTLCGGACLFLTGLGLFKRHSSAIGNYPMSHLFGLLAFALTGLSGWLSPMPTLTLASMGVVIFAIIAVWEWVSFHGGWVERMEARGMRFGKYLRARIDRARERRLAREAAQANQD
jgi:low temperature requirement protein LtrA